MKRLAKKQLTDKELSDYSREHLLYELNMFWQLARTIPKNEPDKPSFTLSVLLESFVIHLRNLTDFFYNRTAPKGYVIARHFFGDPSHWTPNITPALKQARPRANEEVSHLTQGRKSGSQSDKLWGTAGLLKEMEVVARDSAAKASAKKLHPAVKEFLTQPTDEMVLWLEKNVTYSNVAAQSLTSTSNSAGSFSPSAPTTAVIKTK